MEPMSNSHKRLIRDKQVPKGRPEKYRLDELASAGIAGMHLLADKLQIDLRASGRLKLLYGM